MCGVNQAELCRNFEHHLELRVQDELPNDDEELLHQAHELFVLIEKVWERVQYQLCDQLIPQLLEFRRQRECTARIVVGHSMLAAQLLQVFECGPHLPRLSLCLKQISFDYFKAFPLLHQLLSHFLLSHFADIRPLKYFILLLINRLLTSVL